MLEEKDVIDLVQVGIVVLDKELSVKSWNRWMSIHTNIKKDEAHEKKLDELFSFTPSQLKGIKRKVKTAITMQNPTFIVASTDSFLLPIELPLSSQTSYTYMQQDVTIMPCEKGHVMLLIYDQTALMESQKREKKRAEDLAAINEQANKTIEKLKATEKLLVQQRDLIFYQANHDQLTGLTNRHLFQDRLNMAIKESKRNNWSTSLLFIDLDDFKQINDRHGHEVGDEVLIKISNSLKETIREKDTVVRFGGDEFIILLSNTDEKGAMVVANNILKKVDAIEFSKEDIKMTPSIGIASYPKDASSAKELVTLADRALYQAKFKGKNQASIYEKY